uniref:Uncharacterized protein n=1 Tax=Rhizophora mucronata TaxID=61149 RepID=A0A2P2IPN3_RHIMU
MYFQMQWFPSNNFKHSNMANKHQNTRPTPYFFHKFGLGLNSLEYVKKQNFRNERKLAQIKGKLCVLVIQLTAKGHLAMLSQLLATQTSASLASNNFRQNNATFSYFQRKEKESPCKRQMPSTKI